MAIYGARHGKKIDLAALKREQEQKQEARYLMYASEIKHFFKTRRFCHSEDTLLFTLGKSGDCDDDLMIGTYRENHEDMEYPRGYEPHNKQHFYRVDHHRLGLYSYERSHRKYLSLDELVDTIAQHVDRGTWLREQRRLTQYMAPERTLKLDL